MIRIAIVLSCLLSSVFAIAQNLRSNGNAFDISQEKLRVHTDRDFHLAGQVIWFKVYVVNATTQHPANLSRTVYAELIGPDGMPALQAKVKITNGVAPGSFLLPATLASGVYELRAYTGPMKNNPATIYRKRMTVINTQQAFDTAAFVFTDNGENRSGSSSGKKEFKQEVRVRVQTDAKSYHQRSPVEISIGSEGIKSGASLSLAVYKVNELTAPAGFSQDEAKEPLEIRKDGKANFAETNGFVIAAAVRDLEGNPVPDVPLLASLTGKITDVKYNESDANGLAYFSFKDKYGPGHILLKTTPEFSEKVQLEVLNSFAGTESTRPLGKGVFQKRFLPLVEEMHNHLMVNRAFVPGRDHQFYPQNVDSISFYGKPDVVYRLDDYRRFVTMEEVLREYVREVNVRIRNKNYYLPVFSNQLFALADYVGGSKVMDENPPLILLDGIPISANKLMKYDPLKVQKIEVIADRYIISKNIYDGILSFTTYDGNFEGLELDSNDLIADEQGWQYQRQFVIPDYRQVEIRNNRIPDFRELLLWEPLLAITGSGPTKVSLFTGDIKGEFIAVVKGVTDDGRTVNESATFVVE